MFSAQYDFSRRLHPKLGRLEDIFKDLLGRSFDDETLVRLMRMEVETMFPGLGERDQSQIVDIVLEHMQLDADGGTQHKVTKPCNVIHFPTGRRLHR